MVTYDFLCLTCHHKWEQILADSSAGPPECPVCHSPGVKRLFPVPHVARNQAPTPGRTCCGRGERCDTPGCSSGSGCRRT